MPKTMNSIKASRLLLASRYMATQKKNIYTSGKRNIVS
jgi:hypothetical protein